MWKDFFIILKTYTRPCTQKTFRKLLHSTYTTLYKYDVSKVIAFFLFRKKSVAFETSFAYSVAYVY